MSDKGTAQHAGDYIMDDVVILSNTGETHNIQNQIMEVNIFESIRRPVMSGSLMIEDGTALIETAPIVGQERIMFSLTSSKDHEMIDFKTYSGVITEISKRDPSTVGGVQTYILHFNTLEAVKNIRTKVSKSYSGTNEEIVLDILKDENYLNCGKSIEFEPTYGIHNYVMPNLNPLQCIDMISKRSVSATNGSGFIFYENHNGFHFRSIPSLYADESGVAIKPKEIYVYGPPVGPHSEHTFGTKTIVSFEVVNSHNTFYRLGEGMFGSKLTKYDIYNKNFGEYEFNYHNAFKSYNHAMSGETNFGPMLSESPIDDTGKSISEFPDSRCFLVSSGSRDMYTDGSFDNHCEEWLQSGNSRRLEAEFFINKITVHGNSNIAAGDILDLRIPSSRPFKDGTPTKDHLEKFLSGRYIADSVRHKVVPRLKSYVTVIECVKDSIANPMPKSEFTFPEEPKNPIKSVQSEVQTSMGNVSIPSKPSYSIPSFT